MTRFVAGITLCAGMLVTGCQPEDSVLEYTTDMGQCNVNVGLSATTQSHPESGPFHFYGTTTAPESITVRAIYVGSSPVTRSEFNYRSWTVALDLDELKALAVDGVASVPVVAFTSEGCQALSEEERPHVNIPSDDQDDAGDVEN